MRWYKWRWGRLAHAPGFNAETVRETNLTWKHLVCGFYWATKA